MDQAALTSQQWVRSFLTLLAATTTLSTVLGHSPREEAGSQRPPSPLTTTLYSSSHPSFNLSGMTSSAPTPSDDVFLPWDNPYNVISLQTWLTFEKVLFCYVSLGLFLVGAPTNVINCVVFFRQGLGLGDRMNLCLFCLALVDLLFVTLFYAVSSFCMVGHICPDCEQWWKYFARQYFTGVYRGFLYSSGCLTALISLERCVCVLLPLKASSLIRTRTMGVIIAVIVGLIQLATVLYPLHLEIGSRADNGTGGSTLFLTSSQFYADHKLLYSVVEDTLLMVVVPFVTFIVVVVSTVVTVLELKLRLRWRQLSSSSAGADEQQQVRLVKMLVVVSCIYMVTAAPNVALGVARSLVPEFRHTRRYANIFLASHLLYLNLAMANSSINFFVYLARSSRFKAHLFAIMGCPTLRGARSLADHVSRSHSGESAGLQRSRVSRLRDALAAVFGCRESTSSSARAGLESEDGMPASACTVDTLSDGIVCEKAMN